MQVHEQGVDAVGIVELDGIQPKLLGAAQGGLEPPDRPDPLLDFRRRHLIGGDTSGLDAGDLLVQNRLDWGHLPIGREGGLDCEQARPGGVFRPGPNANGHVLLDQGAVQPRGPAAAQDVPQDREGVVVGRVARHGDIARYILRLPGQGVGQGLAPLAGVSGRLGEGGGRGGGTGLDGTEVARDQSPDFPVAEPARDRQDGVRRFIILAVKRADVVEAGGVQIGHRPDGRVLVGEPGISLVQQGLVGVTIGLVVVRLALLLLDHLPLVVQIRLADVQGAHPIGLQEQGQGKLVCGQTLEKIGPVLVGGAVHGAAVRLDQTDMLGLGDILRPLKHHVLKQVGEAAAPRPLAPGADVIGDIGGDDRRRIGARIRGKDDAQAVGQCILREGHLRERGGRPDGTCCQPAEGGGSRKRRRAGQSERESGHDFCCHNVFLALCWLDFKAGKALCPVVLGSESAVTRWKNGKGRARRRSIRSQPGIGRSSKTDLGSGTLAQVLVLLYTKGADFVMGLDLVGDVFSRG